MEKKFSQPPLSRESVDGIADDIYENESAARQKLMAGEISVEIFLTELDKICALGDDALKKNGNDPVAIENASVYYKDAYERLKSVSLSDELIKNKLEQLKKINENLIDRAKDLGDNELMAKLKRRFNMVL